MTSTEKAIQEIIDLRKTLMECSHVLNHTINRRRVGDQLKEKIRRHLARKVLTPRSGKANLAKI